MRFLFPIYHLLKGCHAGQLLFDGKVDIDDKHNKNSQRMKGDWKVYMCKVCKKPMIKWCEIERRSKTREPKGKVIFKDMGLMG